MRKALWSTVLLAVVLSLPGIAAQALAAPFSLLQNGSFDEGLNYWTTPGPVVPVVADLGYPHTTALMMQDSLESNIHYGPATQTVDLAPGLYDLNLSLSATSQVDTAHVVSWMYTNWISMKIFADGNLAGYFEPMPRQWGTFNLGCRQWVNGQVTVSIYLQAMDCVYDGQQSFLSYVAVDDVVLTATPVPEPNCFLVLMCPFGVLARTVLGRGKRCGFRV